MSLESRLGDVISPDQFDETRSSDCAACGSSGLVAFYEAQQIPTQTCVLLDSKADADDYPIGDLLLGFCESCGFIQNVRFDPGLVDYSKPTEESQAFSPRFREFAGRLADDLMTRYDLTGKSLLEVGCGKGDFLVLMAERGLATGLGIDPGFLPNRPEGAATSLSFRREWYGVNHTSLTADLVLTRHLMEHVPNVAEFFGWLALSVMGTAGGSLFTEVPDVLRVLEKGAFWDVYYEHCSYFTLGSLFRSLENAGLGVDHLAMGFNGQYLLSGASKGQGEVAPEGIDQPKEVAERVVEFASLASRRVSFWHDTLSESIRSGESLAVWGGGSKAVAFLSTVSAGPVTVVDINPHKQGKWLPGVGVEVQSPEVLREIRPGLVVPMNAIYVEEIRRDLGLLGLDPEIQPV